MQTVLLNKDIHHREPFDCGVTPLNNYLKLMANQQGRKNNSRTYVLTHSDTQEDRPEIIIGFYTLTLTTIDLSALPQNLQKKHSSSCAGGLIARLAVDKRFKQQGYGEFLLIDALTKMLSTSNQVDFPLVVVDAKDGAKAFYEQYGFTEFRELANKLFITNADVRANIQE